jgi:CubicO group peptidase (beta-lactamase class C family)
MKWLKLLGQALLALVLLLVAIVLFFYARDPAVFRRLLAGPGMGVVTETQRNSPQEAVPGVERDDIMTGPPDSIDATALQAAEAYATQTNSVALLVYHRGALRYEKYWPGFDQDTITDPFSAHKTVLGLLVGAAIADGFIESIDQSASTWLTEWADDPRRDITLRHLLQMSSGLDTPPFGTWTGFRITLGSELEETVLGLSLAKTPGTDFQYSNASSQLLGIVLERATGKRYAQYLSDRLWSRLGAPSAHVWLDREGGMARTFCCLYTTARGWLRVGRLVLDAGRVGADQVVPAEWIEAMTTAAPTNPNYGLQIWLGSPPGKERRYNDRTVKAFHSEAFATDDMIYVDGFGGQRVYIVPSEQLIIVRTGEALLDFDDAVIPNAILRGLQPTPETAADPVGDQP